LSETYQTIYCGYDAKIFVYCSINVGNQFIIAIALRGLWYMANISPAKDCVQALCVELYQRTTLSYGHIPHLFGLID
jgi:hypothetical protein